MDNTRSKATQGDRWRRYGAFAVVNEVLRYDSPVQTDFRIAKREAVIGGKTIRAGEGVILLTGSANRDEAEFSEPDRFDIPRKGPKHAAFGNGVHQCIGAELARMETSAVIASAAARLDRITLAGPQPPVPALDGCARSRTPRGPHRTTAPRGVGLMTAPLPRTFWRVEHPEVTTRLVVATRTDRITKRSGRNRRA